MGQMECRQEVMEMACTLEAVLVKLHGIILNALFY
jgi:hypothetical protein